MFKIMFSRSLTRADKVIFALLVVSAVLNACVVEGRRGRGRRPTYEGFNSVKRRHRNSKTQAVPSSSSSSSHNVTGGNANQVPFKSVSYSFLFLL